MVFLCVIVHTNSTRLRDTPKQPHTFIGAPAAADQNRSDNDDDDGTIYLQ